MAETLYTIQEAAEVADKSIQTIRRALKSRKLTAKKQKTPQGFNYLISEDQLFNFYKLDRQHVPVKKSSESAPTLATAQQTSLVTEYASKEEVHEQKRILDHLVDDNRKDKETFMRFVKVFQDRFTSLESQVKLLEEPAKAKRWYQFWR